MVGPAISAGPPARQRSYYQGGKECLSLLGRPQRWSAYNSAAGVLLHPGGKQVAPVVYDPVRRLVAVPDQFGVGVKKDGRLDFACVHIFVA